MSQDSAQELSQRIFSSYPGVSRTEFQFCCLWIRFVSHVVVRSHSVGVGDSWTFMVTFFDESRVSTLFVFLIYYLPKWHMMSDIIFVSPSGRRRRRALGDDDSDTTEEGRRGR